MLALQAPFGLIPQGFAVIYSAINVRSNRPVTARQRSGVFVWRHCSGNLPRFRQGIEEGLDRIRSNYGFAVNLACVEPARVD